MSEPVAHDSGSNVVPNAERIALLMDKARFSRLETIRLIEIAKVGPLHVGLLRR